MEFKMIFMLVTVAGCAVNAIIASPLVNDNHTKYDDKSQEQVEQLRDYLLLALENFRDSMKDGIPAIQLPPVEPLRLKDQKIKVDKDAVNVDLKLHEIVVTGLSKFEVKELVPDLSNFAAKATLRLPRVTISGEYDVKGKILKIIPLYGDGKYNITVMGAEVGASTSLLLSEEAIEISPVQLHIKWDSLHLDLGNFLGGGSLSKSVEKLIPTLGKSLFEQFRPKILAEASEALTKEANKAMSTEEFKAMFKKFVESAGLLG